MAEYTQVFLSGLFGKARLDAEFYRRRYVENEQRLARLAGTVPLGNLVTVFRKGIFDINAEEYVDEGIPFVRIGDLKDWVIDETNLAYISPTRHRIEAKTALKQGDIILSKTARPAASIVQLEECNVSQDTIAVKTGRSFEYNIYLVAFLNTSVGRLQLERLFQGNIQAHLSLQEARTVLVPQPPDELVEDVAALFGQSQTKKREARQLYHEAESALETALGLHSLSLSQAKTYTASFQEFARSGRLDAGFYQPKYRSLLHHLGRSGQTIGDVTASGKHRVRLPPSGTFRYIEIGNVTEGGRAESEVVPVSEAPSRAQWLLQEGDVLTSSVRPIRRLSALVRPEQSGSVASSGFIVLRPLSIRPEVLTVYLRLPVICELMDLFTTATMYPAISEVNLRALPCPPIADDVQDEVALCLEQSFAAAESAAASLRQAAQRVESLVRGG